MTYNKDAKQRYFDKVYKEASIIECSCGFGTTHIAPSVYRRKCE